MVKEDIWHEIHSRFKRKESKKSIARSLDLDVRTVRKILPQPETRLGLGCPLDIYSFPVICRHTEIKRRIIHLLQYIT